MAAQPSTALCERIFDVECWLLFGQAVIGTRDLAVQSQGRLTNIARRIETLDDPYYMDLAPDTYRATLRGE